MVDCLECGLCCYFCEESAGKNLDGIIIGEDGWCIYFDKKDKCTIYENKPKVCDDFEMGGDGCLLTIKIRKQQEIKKL